MIPKDIVGGQEYSHKSYPGVVYLGCDEFGTGKDKHLVIYEIPDPPKDNYTTVGNRVLSLSNAGIKYWDGFYLKKNLTSAIKSA